MTDFDPDIPDEVWKAAREANKDLLLEMLDEKLRDAAIVQKQAGVRAVMLTVQANGDIIISAIADNEGNSHVPYARVDRLTRKLTRLSKLGQPPSE